MPLYVDPASLKSINASGGNGAGGDHTRHRYTLSVTGAADCPSCKQPAYVTSTDGLRYCQSCAYEDPDSAALPAAPPDERPDPDEVQARDARLRPPQRPKPTAAGQPRSDAPSAGIGNDALAGAQALLAKIRATEDRLVAAREELLRLVDIARVAGVPIPPDLAYAVPERATPAWRRQERRRPCPDCGRVCGSSAGLAVHRKAKHPDIKEAT